MKTTALMCAALLSVAAPAVAQQTATFPDNPEMTAIFKADQAVRADTSAAVDWASVWAQDEARLQRTKQLLEASALRSGSDFYHAATVFQHGREPNDFLVAHTLAIIAAARGKEGAAWMAAATLDRYLKAVGHSQVYGTQYTTRDGQETTQEPYDRTAISDALREAMGVPSQAQQEVRRREIQARRGAAKR